MTSIIRHIYIFHDDWIHNVIPSVKVQSCLAVVIQFAMTIVLVLPVIMVMVNSGMIIILFCYSLTKKYSLHANIVIHPLNPPPTPPLQHFSPNTPQLCPQTHPPIESQLRYWNNVIKISKTIQSTTYWLNHNDKSYTQAIFKYYNIMWSNLGTIINKPSNGVYPWRCCQVSVIKTRSSTLKPF